MPTALDSDSTTRQMRRENSHLKPPALWTGWPSSSQLFQGMMHFCSWVLLSAQWDTLLEPKRGDKKGQFLD